MSGWNGGGRCGHSSGSGAEHEPSEERGQAAWGTRETGSVPPWASAETQIGGTLPPPPVTPAYGHTPPQSATPAYPPPRARRSGAGRALAAIALTVALGAGAGTGVWFLIRDTATGTGATPATGVTVTTSATAPPTTPSRSPAPAAGYRRAQDPVGYSIDVPEGWTRRQKQGQLAPVVSYDAPADGRQLQIFELAEDTPARSLDLAENDPGYGFVRQAGYRVLDRTSGAGWSELAYRYDDEDKGPRQVVDHRFRTAGGRLYAIRSSGPERPAPTLVREPLATAPASFCPAGRRCT
jgi:hypothetical protein